MSELEKFVSGSERYSMQTVSRFENKNLGLSVRALGMLYLTAESGSL